MEAVQKMPDSFELVSVDEIERMGLTDMLAQRMATELQGQRTLFVRDPDNGVVYLLSQEAEQ